MPSTIITTFLKTKNNTIRNDKDGHYLQTFPSILDAAKSLADTNLQQKNLANYIGLCCSGKRKTTLRSIKLMPHEKMHMLKQYLPDNKIPNQKKNYKRELLERR